MVVMTVEDVFSQKTLYIDVGGTVTLLASGLAWPGLAWPAIGCQRSPSDAKPLLPNLMEG